MENLKKFLELSKNIKKDIPKGDVLILGDMRDGAQEGDWKGKWLGSDFTKVMILQRSVDRGDCTVRYRGRYLTHLLCADVSGCVYARNEVSILSLVTM